MSASIAIIQFPDAKKAREMLMACRCVGLKTVSIN